MITITVDSDEPGQGVTALAAYLDEQLGLLGFQVQHKDAECDYLESHDPARRRHMLAHPTAVVKIVAHPKLMLQE